MITKFTTLALSNFKKYRNFNNTQTFSPTPTIATSSTLIIGSTNPSIVITTSTPSYSFRTGVVLSDFTIGAGTTGLTASSLTRNSATQVTIAFTGTIANGTLTVQAGQFAAEPPSVVSSNVLNIQALPSSPTIATTSTVAAGAVNPSVVVTMSTSGYSFKTGIVLSDFTIGVGTTTLTASTLTRNSATQVTIAFTGTATGGNVTIQAKTSASDPTSGAASNTLTVSVRVISATGGSEIKTIGKTKYHIFDASSTFSISSNPASAAVEIAVIGAGAGGGRGRGGAGGGGAKEPSSGYSTQTLSAGSYTVTIAAGGTGSTGDSTKGGTPSATSFAGSPTISARGGGGGGSISSGAGSTGGSGGGGAQNSSAGSASGNNTNAGGAGSGNAGGGGGGATAVGAAGQTVPQAIGGNGGAGLTLTTIDANLTSGNFTSFSGMTVISSGGGGGADGNVAGTGGTGAGNGSASNAAAGNAVSFGSGGGGGGSFGFPAQYGNGGNGFKGLVIVRYPV